MPEYFVAYIDVNLKKKLLLLKFVDFFLIKCSNQNSDKMKLPAIENLKLKKKFSR